MTIELPPLYTLALKYKNGLRYGEPAYYYCPANVYPTFVRKKARYVDWSAWYRFIPCEKGTFEGSIADYVKSFDEGNNLVSLP